MQPHSPAKSATSLAPTPLAAALSQSGISLPIPFLDLSAQVIRDLRLENVAALQRFIAEAKSELGTLSNMLQTGLEMRYGEQAKTQLLAKARTPVPPTSRTPASTSPSRSART